jgi:hypothetical protein
MSYRVAHPGPVVQISIVVITEYVSHNPLLVTMTMIVEMVLTRRKTVVSMICIKQSGKCIFAENDRIK